MPELDLQASFTILIAAAIMGFVFFLSTIVILSLPAGLWIWIYQIVNIISKDKNKYSTSSALRRLLLELNDLWYKRELSNHLTIICFDLPLIGPVIIFPLNKSNFLSMYLLDVIFLVLLYHTVF